MLRPRILLATAIALTACSDSIAGTAANRAAAANPVRRSGGSAFQDSLKTTTATNGNGTLGSGYSVAGEGGNGTLGSGY